MNNLIIVHPGKAHFDEFMAVSFILAVNKNKKFTIERREPLKKELDNPDIWVVDIGERYEKEFKNFDHHQDLDLDVSFVIVADYLGLVPTLSKLPWWSFKNKIDSMGPIRVAKELGIETLSPTQSALEEWFIKLFEKNPKEVQHLMRAFGESVINQAEELESLLEYWDNCEKIKLKNQIVLIGLTESTKGVEEFIETMEEPANICITYDNRGDGWKLRRHNDCPEVDFSKLEGHKDIKFAHKSGFIAKTKTRLPIKEIFELIKQAIN